jgi:hypothetical protein
MKQPPSPTQLGQRLPSAAVREAESGYRLVVWGNRKFTANSPSPPFRGEREGPRRDRAGEGEVGSAANYLRSAPLTPPSPPGRRGERVKKLGVGAIERVP